MKVEQLPHEVVDCPYCSAIDFDDPLNVVSYFCTGTSSIRGPRSHAACSAAVVFTMLRPYRLLVLGSLVWRKYLAEILQTPSTPESVFALFLLGWTLHMRQIISSSEIQSSGLRPGIGIKIKNSEG